MVSRDIIYIREFREIKEVKDISEISEIRAIRAISDDAIGLGFVVSLWLTSPQVRMLRLGAMSADYNRTHA